MDKHEDAAGLRLVRIGGKGTAWIFTEQAERAQVHSTVWRHGEHAASASTSMSTGTSTGMRVDPAPSPALSSMRVHLSVHLSARLKMGTEHIDLAELTTQDGLAATRDGSELKFERQQLGCGRGGGGVAGDG